MTDYIVSLGWEPNEEERAELSAGLPAGAKIEWKVTDTMPKGMVHYLNVTALMAVGNGRRDNPAGRLGI